MAPPGIKNGVIDWSDDLGMPEITAPAGCGTRALTASEAVAAACGIFEQGLAACRPAGEDTVSRMSAAGGPSFGLHTNDRSRHAADNLPHGGDDPRRSQGA